MADGASAHNRWLFSPLADLVLGCGLAYAGVFVWMSLFGPGFIATNPLYYMPLVSLALSGPHYGATLLRVYERAADRRRYAFFAVWATLVVIVAFAVAVNNPFFGSLFFTLYVTWSPRHYTGQNYGLAVMFLRRRGLSFEPSAKRWLYASFITSYIMTFLVLHGSNEAAGHKVKAAVTTTFDTDALLASLKATTQPTIRLFRQLRAAPSADDRNVIDSDQLENLRALGYAE